ncbi:MAG: malto-oligosyltrehalose trehalohydrolase [Alphaproteobacteria bacterium]|nr:malto-oligosyltrehalose trehalohydrolase [Alphaproteobacteria bacterium]
MPFGAQLLSPDKVRFRLWAPKARELRLLVAGRDGEARRLPMMADAQGWREAVVDGAGAGTRYAFLLEDGLQVPDPATRFQPDDVHGPSEVIDPAAYDWQDAAWRGRPWREAVLYETHIGAFTPGGTFAAAAEKLDHLAALGVTAIELMPVADFPGRRNWGYDGALPFAPDSAYGRPEELKKLVDQAHARGLMVFLDVVYNHFGPDGNYLGLYAPFFTERHATPWGAAIDFDGPASGAVREFFVQNALFWLEEYHMDGLRLDAVDTIADDSPKHILYELAERVRAQSAGGRHVHLVLENDRNEARYLGDSRYDAQWNDDFHHALHCAVTGERNGYYADYAGDAAAHLGRTLTSGFAYQGEPSPFRGGRRRGEPSGRLPPTAFVGFIQNHDQVGNRAFGERIHALAAADALHAAIAILLLAPSPPLLFMGEEWRCDRPFLYFCDFADALADAVREGRRSEFARLDAFRDEAARARIPDPNDIETFRASVLDWSQLELPDGRACCGLYRRLLALRRREIVPRLDGVAGDSGTFERFGERGLHCRWTLAGGDALSLLANLGAAPCRAAAGAGRGRTLYATHARCGEPDGHAMLPGWSAAWSLDDARSGDAGPGQGGR